MLEPAQVLSGFYAAEAAYLAAGGPGAASTAPLGDYLHQDIVIYEAASLPYGGEWRGLEGIEAFMARLSEVYVSSTLQARTISIEGEVAMVLTHSLVRSRSTGRTMTNIVLQRNVIRDGLIVEMRPFHWDTAAILELVTP